MLEDLRYQYHGRRFIVYVKRFNDARKSNNSQASEKWGAKAIAVGEKLLDLENRLTSPMEVSIEGPLSQVKSAYTFIQATKEVRQHLEEFKASRRMS